VYCPLAPKDYREQSFLQYAIEYLVANCPLCGGEHPAKFFAFVARSYLGDSCVKGTTFIKVPRLICEPNKEKRRQTGEPLQYTLRILPGFLIPHSRVVVDLVHEALEGCIGQHAATRLAATLLMGCLSPLSFRLFYQRVQERIVAWLDVLVRLIGELGGEIAEQGEAAAHEPLQAQWRWFHLLVSELLRVHARLPGAPVVLRPLRWQFVYALLSRHQMGLGP